MSNRKHAHAAAGKLMLMVAAVGMLSGCFRDSDPQLQTFAAQAAAVGGQSNRAPEILGVPPAVAHAGEFYSFTPDAVDSDEDWLEFSVTNKPSWATFSAETGVLEGTPTDHDIGQTDEVIISVTDGRDERAVGPFRIRVKASGASSAAMGNTTPTISGTPAASVTLGQTYTFQPTASDAEGDVLQFAISNRPSWASFDTSTGRLTGKPAKNRLGEYRNIVISVSDGHTSARLAPFAIAVVATNTAPIISGAAATSVQVGQIYAFQPSVRDAEGDALTFAVANLPSWASFDSTTGRLSGAPINAHVGIYPNIVISVADGQNSASLPAFVLQVNAAGQNRVPTIAGSPMTEIQAGQTYNFQPTGTDADGDTLGFSIQNKPTWLSFDTATGRLTGTPTSSQVSTYSGIVVSVSDGKLSASLPAFSIQVRAATAGVPMITGTPAVSASVGASYTFQPAASDPNGDRLSFSIANRPAWATFDTTTGRLSGTPSQAHVGSYTGILISVSDGVTAVSLPAFTINVSSVVSGSAKLSWVPPTQNADGSALTNLAGYRVVYGTSQSALSQTIEITDPNATSYIVENLAAGTYYFAVKAYSSGGAESSISNVASKTIQ